MKDVIVGIAGDRDRRAFCFWGYFAMRIVIPIWGFFAGFMLGAGATSLFDNSEFLSTVLGWVLGFFIGLLFAVIAYLFYEIAIVLAFASIGFTFGAATDDRAQHRLELVRRPRRHRGRPPVRHLRRRRPHADGGAGRVQHDRRRAWRRPPG